MSSSFVTTKIVVQNVFTDVNAVCEIKYNVNTEETNIPQLQYGRVRDEFHWARCIDSLSWEVVREDLLLRPTKQRMVGRIKGKSQSECEGEYLLRKVANGLSVLYAFIVLRIYSVQMVFLVRMCRGNFSNISLNLWKIIMMLSTNSNRMLQSNLCCNKTCKTKKSAIAQNIYQVELKGGE